MVKKAVVEQIQLDFNFTKKNPKILGILLYGSRVTEDITSRSDIDICVVVPNHDLHQIYEYLMENFQGNVEGYDIRFFEELSLYIQAEVIEKGVVLICQDEPTLFEYFFKYRKRWQDQKYRLDLLAT